MAISVIVEFDHCPTDKGLEAGFWLVVQDKCPNSKLVGEQASFLKTKPTKKQIRKAIKQFKD